MRAAVALAIIGSARAQFQVTGAFFPPAGLSADGFGNSMAVTGDAQDAWVAIGAPGVTRGGAAFAGAAHILRYLFPTSASNGTFNPDTNTLTYVAPLLPTLAAPAQGEGLGSDIAMNEKGTIVAVGACCGACNLITTSAQPPAGSNCTGTGRVYIFSGARTQGAAGFALVNTQVLVPALMPAAVGDYFGSALAMSSSGATIIACSPGAQTSRGRCAVYLAVNDTLPPTYREAATLSPSVVHLNAFFGGNDGSVALSGNGLTAVIGAPGESGDSGVLNTGAAFVYSVSSATAGAWITAAPFAIFPPAGVATNSVFGWMVAITGDGSVIAIGAAGDMVGSVRAGSVCLYRPNARPELGWVLVGRFTPAAPAGGMQFGAGLSFSGDGLVLHVGAPGDGAVTGTVHSISRFSTRNLTWVLGAGVQRGDGAALGYGAASANWGYNVKGMADGQSLMVAAPQAAQSAAGAAAGGAYALSKGYNSSWLAALLLWLATNILVAVVTALVLFMAFCLCLCCCCCKKKRGVVLVQQPKV